MREILLETGQITPTAIDLTTNKRVKVLTADLERGVALIEIEEDCTEFRLFEEIQCIQIVEDKEKDNE